ncbi:DNA-processing protein DprA [Mucilaginibacter sp. RS28]|uniref:DNA-processing protein DprA n=1 Tax=Mucilaginibacter straminoryzae TaxID=2932774 RepID=A0A9X1X421_9SPHI|nr:DNA-processing protein DprA [Mucilaginibacter straminoryzae]MCJ8209960.1 DNA-processing protein DprA [Mucilaginibacter straminoryzae]
MSLLHQLALTFIRGVGPVLAKNMLAYAGSAENVFNIAPAKLLKAPGVGEKRLEMLDFNSALKRAEEELALIEQHGIDVVFYTDPKYPKRLRACNDSPVLLYTRGDMDLNNGRVVSIVGSRKTTEYGRLLCRQLVAELQAYDVLIVSGLAYGIDGEAHKQALQLEMPTVGVVGHGMGSMYPAAHRSLADKMMKNGGMITEYPYHTIADPKNFPTRNRIVAGLADVTVVIEAGIKSGTLITAEIANSYNRDVFAFPGRVGDELSEGCNFLIRHHKAGLLTCVEDLAFIMGWEKGDKEAQPKQSQLALAMDLSSEERSIITVLNEHPSIAIDELTLKLGMPVSQLTMNLLNLEMQGFIRSMPGKTYALN